MNIIGRKIAKNASVLMVSQVITWSFALVQGFFLPRFLGPEQVGRFHLAISLWSIVTMLIVFGTDTLLVKELARNPSRTREFFGTAIGLRVLLFIAGFGILTLYARIAGYPAQTVQALYVASIGIFVGQLGGVCTAMLQGLERMEFVSISDIVGKLFATSAMVFALLNGAGVLVILGIVAVTAAIGLAIQFAALRKIQPLQFNFRWELAGWMLKAGFPYLMAYAFLGLYMQVDVVVISLFASEKVIGWYGSAERLFGTLLFVPTVFMTAVFPALSRMYKTTPDALPRIMSRSFRLLFLISIPVGLGIFVVANPLVVLLFGPEFADSGPVLAVMGIVLVLTYQNMLFGQYLISTDRQNRWTLVLAVCALLTIPLDLLLVPWSQQIFGNGALGGAFSFAITEFGMFIAGLLFLPKGFFSRSDLWMAAKVLLAGGVMALAAWWQRELLFLSIGIGAVTFVGLILLMRAIPQEDLGLLKQIGWELYARFPRRRPLPAGISGEN